MPEVDLVQISEILLKANNRGMKISFGDNELTLTFSKQNGIDREFLEELKANKDRLVDYFIQYGQMGSGGPHDLSKSAGKYHAITQKHHYWVDETSDRELKRQTYGLLNFRITGHLDPDIFSKAVAYLVLRHESLRSTFHQRDDAYVMTVAEDPAPYALDYRDLRSLPAGSGDTVDNLFYFYDHAFDLANGPLFLVRLLQVEEAQYLLSAKLHHVIYDAWSREILLRDLLIAYTAYAKGERPRQRPLKWQYKDYMSYMNEVTEKKREEHKAYWRTLYHDLPGELIIPGAKRTEGDYASAKVCAAESFILSKKTVTGLNGLSGKYASSLFVILQAACKAWLQQITGQHDLVIGTEAFGRDDLENSEEQIGFYAQMILIRTVLDSTDTLDEVIKKVKKSNEDTRKYRRFSLMETLSGMLPPPYILYGSFWKITLNYTDSNGYFLDRSAPVSGSPAGMPQIEALPDPRQNAFINWDMDLHFFNLEDKMELKVTYNTDLYDAQTVRELIDGYLNFIRENLQ